MLIQKLPKWRIENPPFLKLLDYHNVNFGVLYLILPKIRKRGLCSLQLKIWAIRLIPEPSTIYLGTKIGAGKFKWILYCYIYNKEIIFWDLTAFRNLNCEFLLGLTPFVWMPRVKWLSRYIIRVHSRFEFWEKLL